MEEKELTIADILDVTKRVRLVEHVQKDGRTSCEGCVFHGLCEDATVLKSYLCFQGAEEGKDLVYVFDKEEV